MKTHFKVLVLSCFLILGELSSFSQPRFGIRAGGDNSGRVVNFGTQGYSTATSVSYKATVAITPTQKFQEFIRIDSVDANSTDGACTMTIATTGAKQWDQLTLLFDSLNIDASRVVTFSTGTLPNGTLTIAKGKTAFIRFLYDASRQKWIELCRTTGL
jgi:hypothetical protein